MSQRIIKPFSCNTKDHPERVYNYKLSKIQRCLENAFGVLATKFQVSSWYFPLLKLSWPSLQVYNNISIVYSSMKFQIVELQLPEYKF